MDTEIERSENQLLAAATAAGAMLVAGLLVPFRSHLTGTTVALVMMVVVVCAAAVGGRFAGVATAVTATLSYDFLFTRPYQSLKITSADDVEITILLLVCGLIVGTVAARAERSGSVAARMKDDLLHVHRLAELVAAGSPVAEVIAAAEVQLTDLLGLGHCRFESPSGTEPIPLLSRSGAVMARSGVGQGHQVYRIGRLGFELPQPAVAVPVLVGGQDVGRFVLTPTVGRGTSLDQRVAAIACVDQVGASIGLSQPTLENEVNSND